MRRPPIAPGKPQQSPLSLLVIRDHLIWSGGTFLFADVLPRLDPARVQAKLAVVSPGRAATEIFAERGVPVLDVDGRAGDPWGLGALMRVVRKMRPDLLYLSGPKAMLRGRLLSAMAGVPAVPFINNALPEPALQRWAQRRLAGRTARAVAVSQAMADWAATAYALPLTRIDVLYGGRDLAPFLSNDPIAQSQQRRDHRARLGIAEAARVILLSGRVHSAQKGQLAAIDCFAALRPQAPDAHLLIAGDGPDLDACKTRVAALGLTGAVSLPGRQSDMPGILAASDIAVIPSQCNEAFGFVAIEAAASGRPVVAFRDGGLPEALCDGETGLLVDRGDWAGLSSALLGLLADPTRSQAMGRAGQRFATHFAIETYVDRLTDLLEQAAGRTPRGADGSP